MPVAARFHDTRDKVLAEVDFVFAEPIRLFFLNASGLPDATRPNVEIEAVLRVGEGKSTNVAGGFAQSWRTRIVADKAQLHIDRAKYPTLLVKPKDRLKALSRSGEPLFEVADVDDRGTARLVLNLNEA